LARRLGFRHLDSGGLYRALTFALLEDGIPSAEWNTLTSRELDALGVRVEPGDARVDIYRGEQVLSSELRSAEVTKHVSAVASLAVVREWLLGIQRALGEHGNLVVDGRDMGTVVFPDADLKVFLVAGLEARARRRLLQDSGAAPSATDITAEAGRIEERDRSDSDRELSPLRRPEGAFDVDTTALSFQEQVSLILRRVKDLTAL
jgi:cytidylate kinase